MLKPIDVGKRKGGWGQAASHARDGSMQHRIHGWPRAWLPIGLGCIADRNVLHVMFSHKAGPEWQRREIAAAVLVEPHIMQPMAARAVSAFFF